MADLAARGRDSREIVDAWAAELDVRPRTRDGYLRALRPYLAFLDGRGASLESADRSDLIAYRDRLSATVSPATARAYLAPVRAVHGWIARETGRPSPADGVRGPRAPKSHSRDALTRDQLRAIAAASEGRAASGDLGALRDSALILTMGYCGLRPVEAARADVGDLRAMGGRQVLWVRGKGRDAADEFVVVPETPSAAISRYLRARGGPEAEAPLFSGHGNRNRGRLTVDWVSRTCKAAMRSAGIDDPHVTAHSLRHTAVTAALLGGADLQAAQAMARHSKLETTLLYAHNLDRLAAPAEDAAARYLEGDA